MNTTLSDIASALTASIANDGQTTPVANLPMGGFKLTGLGDATVANDAIRYNGALGTPSSGVATNLTGTAAGLTSGNATTLTGTTTAAIQATALGSGTADTTTFLRGDRTFQSIHQIQPISASVASNALTISASALSLDFRSTTLGSGTISTVTGTPSNLVISSGSTLGTVSGTQSRIAVLALNNTGTIELAAVNISGGNDLSETGLISTTAEGGSGVADSANVIYSTTARSNVAYRLIGYIESTQATAGTWATAPSTIQGAGGQALAAMSSLGYGQTWQNFTGSRAFATNYYNTTGKPITVMVTANSSVISSFSAYVNGVSIGAVSLSATYNGCLTWVVPPGMYYSADIGAVKTLASWYELR
jgi:hypothetical protein